MGDAGLLQLLGFQKGEYKQVVNLALVKFLLGLAESLFFVVAISLFLGESEIKTYGIAVALSGVFFLVHSYVAKQVRKKYRISNIYPFLSYFNILIVLSISLYAFFGSGFNLGLISLCCFFVFSVNNNLLSWDLSSNGYDLQGKKVLGETLDLVDILASLVGFMGVPLFVQVFDVQYLFFGTLMFLGTANYFLNKCMKSRYFVAQNYFLSTKKSARKTEQLKFERKYLVLIILLAVMALTVSSLVHYLFLVEVQLQYVSSLNIAVFLGTFYAFGRGVSVIFEIFWFTRGRNSEDVKAQLLSYPILLLSVLIGIYLLISVKQTTDTVYYLFGILMLFNMVLYDGIARRVFIDLLTPLRPEKMSEGFRLLKGVGEGVAFIISGVIIFLFEVEVHAFIYFLFALIALWVLMVHFGVNLFFNNIIHAFNYRIPGLEHVTLTSKVLQKKVSEIIDSNNINDLSFVYSLLSLKAKRNLLKRLLSIDNESFLLFSLAEHNKLGLLDVDLLRLENLLNHKDERLRVYSFELYARLVENPKTLMSYYRQENQLIKSSILSGFLRSEKIEHVTLGGTLLNELLKDNKTKNQAISIVGKVGNPDFFRPVLDAFKSGEEQLIKSALKSSVAIKNEILIPALISYLGDLKYGGLAVNALVQYEDNVILKMSSLIEEKVGDKLFLIHCINICGQVDTSLSRRFLKRLLKHKSQSIFLKTLEALSKASFHMNSKNKEYIIDLLDHELELSLYVMQAMFVLNNKKCYKNTVHALSEEFKLCQNKIIIILSYVLDRSIVSKAKEGLRVSDDLARSDFLIDLGQALSAYNFRGGVITTLDESIPLDQKIKLLEARNHQAMVTEKTICDKILYEGGHDFSAWTISSLIRDLGENNVEKDRVKKMDSLVVSQMLNMNEALKVVNFDKIQLLKSTDIFSQTPEHALIDLADIMEEIKFSANETIFNKGDLGFHMFVIYRGQVLIEDMGKEIIKFGEKDFFGELSLLDPEPRSASAVAVEEVILYKIERDAFFDIMANRSEVTKGIMKVLCKRLRNQTQASKND